MHFEFPKDPYPNLLTMFRPVHLPPRYGLPDVKVSLQNMELWQQFHEIGTEMIITKSGRRMFPSLRVAFSGLEKDAHYCVVLEMAPLSDCRYKFSGSQWVPAGGAEPQSTQRMYIHPDSPALGSHWQAQPVIFNKVKLTNNTLDSNGHMVLTSMHKYQPRLHIIRTSEPSLIPWAPQQAFTFPETEFVAVTAYQNDRITKLKIDNNPFAKGFRELGQSRIKRKLATKPDESSLCSADKKLKTSEMFDYNKTPAKDTTASRKRSNSLSESTSSADESFISIGDEIPSPLSSGSSSPDTSVQDYHSNAYDEPTNCPLKSFEAQHNSHLQPDHRQMSNGYMDFWALRHTHQHMIYPPPQMFAPNVLEAMRIQYANNCAQSLPPMEVMRAAFEPTIPSDVAKIALLDHSRKTPKPINPPTKRTGFSISAILGCES